MGDYLLCEVVLCDVLLCEVVLCSGSIKVFYIFQAVEKNTKIFFRA